MLVEDPSWTAAPWVDVLDALRDRSLLAWFFAPSHEGPDRERVVLALQMIARRPDPQVAAQVRWLRRHRDPEIQDLVRDVLEAASRQVPNSSSSGSSGTGS